MASVRRSGTVCTADVYRCIVAVHTKFFYMVYCGVYSA